jgi:hypothetical protein
MIDIASEDREPTPKEQGKSAALSNLAAVVA